MCRSSKLATAGDDVC